MSETGGPLLPDEVRQLMEFVRKHERYGQIALKTENGKITRVTVEHNLLPDEVRKMIRA